MAGDGSGRHERPIPRNKKEKIDDEEDAPTYVMEETNDSLTKAEYEALVAGKGPEDEDAAKEKSDQATGTALTAAKTDTIAEVGKTSKKRKAIKVIGGEDNEDVKSEKDSGKKVTKKAKKKGKPIKLSFGDDEG